MQQSETKPTQLQISQALHDANGDFSLAAAALGFTEKSLENLVDGDAALKARWREKPKAPPQSSLIHRPDDVAIAEAVMREEARFKASLANTGMSAKAQSLAVSCQNLQRNSGNSLMQATGGGIGHQFFETMARIDKADERIAELDQRLGALDVPPEQVIAYETLLREDRSRMCDDRYKLLAILHQYASKVDQSVLIQAKVQKMLGEGNGKGGGGPSKPGFTPLKKAEAAIEQAT